MARMLSFLGKETQWGKVAGIALGAAILTMILSSGQLTVLSLMTFSLGGILVERAAPRHPFWNALVFGLLGIVFMLVLAQLVQLGTNQPLLTLAEAGQGVLSLSLYTMPQAMMGAWIGVTIRRAGEMARQKQEQKEKGKEKEKEKQSQPSLSTGSAVQGREGKDKSAPARQQVGKGAPVRRQVRQGLPSSRTAGKAPGRRGQRVEAEDAPAIKGGATPSKAQGQPAKRPGTPERRGPAGERQGSGKRGKARR